MTDSKALSAKKRFALEPLIKNCSYFGIGVVWQQRIDAINILQSTFEAMGKAVCSLRKAPGQIVIDGNKTIPSNIIYPMWQKHFASALPPQQAIIKGDAKVPAIAAASILAKTFRDRLMQHLAKRWPGYGFEQHVGYGTKMHLAAIKQLGPCPLHRMTFRGVREEDHFMAQGSLF